MSSGPLVNVVMPVYNNEKYLREAVESILAQTFRDFELIVVNDGSTDGSITVLEEYRQRDRRVVIHNHSKNQGIVAALNRGIRMGRSKYIARMDADDISLPNRLEVQSQFLNSHPNIGLVGSGARLINSTGRVIGYQSVVTGPLNLQWNLLFNNPLIHPSVILRREVLEKMSPYYSAEFIGAEDYDLWTRMALSTQFENINTPLIKYRLHPLSTTSALREHQLEAQLQISIRTIRRLCPELKLTNTAILNLCGGLMGFGGPRFRQIKRAVAAKAFLDLWYCYSAHFQGNSEIPIIMQSVLSKAAKLALFPPFQKDQFQIIRRLRHFDQNWSRYFARSLPPGIFSFIQNQLTRFQNQ